MKKKLCLLLALMMVIAAFAMGCGGNDDGGEGVDSKDASLTDVQAKDELVLGLDDSFPPMGFNDNGEIVGFDIDVAREVCAILGVELVVQPIDWKTKEIELNSGNIDCIWNGMSVNAEREEQMSLSIPYMPNHMALVVKPDSGIATVADMTGKKLALQAGSTAEEALASEDGASLNDVIAQPVNTFSENLTALMDLDSGNSDAVLMDDVVANYLIKTSGKDLVVLNDFLYAENYAIGFRKDDAALTEAVNDALRQLKENGKLAEISTKWFGADVTNVE